MKFTLLGYFDEEKWMALPEGERDAIMDECFAFDQELLEDGRWVGGGQALQGAGTAKTLRREGGKLIVTDGPYAETKEQLGGLGVFEARDVNHAVEIMSKHPAARLGWPFEIRPIDESLNERCKPTGSEGAIGGEGGRFACLGYWNEEKRKTMSKEEYDAMLEACFAYGDELGKHGEFVGGVALQGAETAKTLRSRNGEVIVTDGPYAETKEQLGGVATLKFRDMELAIRAWSNHPCLLAGDTLEIRPVDEAFEAQWEAKVGQVATASSSGTV